MKSIYTSSNSFVVTSSRPFGLTGKVGLRQFEAQEEIVLTPAQLCNLIHDLTTAVREVQDHNIVLKNGYTNG